MPGWRRSPAGDVTHGGPSDLMPPGHAVAIIEPQRAAIRPRRPSAPPESSRRRPGRPRGSAPRLHHVGGRALAARGRPARATARSLRDHRPAVRRLRGTRPAPVGPFAGSAEAIDDVVAKVADGWRVAVVAGAQGRLRPPRWKSWVNATSSPAPDLEPGRVAWPWARSTPASNGRRRRSPSLRPRPPAAPSPAAPPEQQTAVALPPPGRPAQPHRRGLHRPFIARGREVRRTDPPRRARRRRRVPRRRVRPQQARSSARPVVHPDRPTGRGQPLRRRRRAKGPTSWEE